MFSLVSCCRKWLFNCWLSGFGHKNNRCSCDLSSWRQKLLQLKLVVWLLGITFISLIVFITYVNDRNQIFTLLFIVVVGVVIEKGWNNDKVYKTIFLNWNSQCQYLPDVLVGRPTCSLTANTQAGTERDYLQGWEDGDKIKVKI